MRRTPFICILLLLALRPLAADGRLDDLLREAPFSEPEKQSIVDFFTLARSRRVPDELLLPRLEEGIAKRVPAARLLPALRNELGFLSRARDILAAAAPRLDPGTQTPAWQRAALLLHNGIPEAVVAAIALASVKRWADFRAATDLYLALTAWGLETPVAQKVVTATLASRLGAADFGGVAALFSKGRARYLAPRGLADLIVRALPAVETAADLERRVLD